MFARTSVLVASLLVCAHGAWSQVPRSCSANAFPVATVRSLGVAEMVSDVVVSCSAQTFATGTALPVATVSATLSAASGNRVFVGGYTDALLLLGEPNESSQFPCTLDACAGIAGAAYGNGPLENRNVFAGRLTGANTISWNVPLDGGTQVMRIVNLRVNASTLAGQGVNVAVTSVGASLAVSGAVTPLNVTVANLNPGIDFAVRSADANATVRLNNNAITNSPVGADNDFQFFLRFVETTPFAWRNRSVVAGAADPTAVRTQSRPGQSSEPRFLLSETGYYNQTFPALNGLSAAGLGDSGSRLVARFANIPANVRLYISTTPLADFTSGVTARLITTDGNGVGFFSTTPPAAFIRGGTVGVAELPVSAGQAVAVWEILDPSVELDRLNFGAFLSWNTPIPDATVTVQGMLGPISPTGTVSTGPKFAVINTSVNAAIIGNGGPGGGTGGGGTGGGGTGGGGTGGGTGTFAVAAPDALPPGTAGQPYNAYTLATNPPAAGTTWSVIEGTFPPGMTFAANGVIAGTPLFPGTYLFTVRAQSVFGQTATARIALLVRTSQLQVSSVGIVNGVVGTALTPVPLNATGGTQPLRWFAQTERIPPGLVLSENGILTGVPSVEGLFSLPVFVQDGTGTTAQVVATFSITGFLRIVTPSPLPPIFPGSSYRQSLEPGGGQGPFRWSLVAGALPLGIALDSSGVLLGTPAAPGRSAFVVQVADATGRSATRSYTLDVLASGVGLGRIRVQPEGLNMTGSQVQLLRLSADSPSSTPVELSTTTESGGNWLSVDRASLPINHLTPGHIAIRTTAAGLAEGSYQGQVVIRAGDATRTIPVSLSVAPTVQMTPAALSFRATAGGRPTLAQTVLIQAPSVAGGANFTAIAGAFWISTIRSDSGLEISVNPASLAAGDYWGEVIVTSAARVARRTITVMAHIDPADAMPSLAPSTGGLLLRGSGDASLSLLNPGRDASAYFLTRDFGDAFQWFTVTPATESLEPGAPRLLTVAARPAITPGVRRGVLSLAFGNAPLRQVEVAAIEPGDACRATRLVTVLASPSIDELVRIGQPAPVQAIVADDCGQAVDTGAASLLTPDGGVPLVSAGAGNWYGTWRPAAGAVAGPWTLTLAARSGNLEGSADRTIHVAESEIPTISAVVTGGTFSRYRAVAPNSFLTILGSGLDNSVLTLNGQQLQTVFASSRQVNALVPPGVPAGQIHPLVVYRGTQVSVPEPVAVAAVSPDVFVISQPGGRAQGAVTDPQFRLLDETNPAETNPAGPGGVIVVFCTGLGNATTATLTVGGVPATVLGLAPSPGFPGLYQVSAQLGAGTPAQASAPLVLTAGGLSSPPVVIATRR